MEIINDFLPKEQFNALKNVIMGNQLPYYYESSVAEKNDNKNFYFVHEFYLRDKVKSNYFNIILPLLKKLNCDSLIRAKVNCFPRTEKLIKYGEHKDMLKKHNGAILYINTCNGGTYLKDDFVPSVENKILLFDPSKPHQSTNCTDEKCRFNININY